jgi:hypothetical protein
MRGAVVDWSLFGCARKGHVTYAPDEPDLRDRLMASTAGGTAWRCLRCGTFVHHPGKIHHGTGPAAEAPLLRRGRELRDELILRVFAVERFIRFVVFAAAAYGVWRFKYDRGHIQQAFNHDLPAIRQLYQDLGFDFDHSNCPADRRPAAPAAAPPPPGPAQCRPPPPGAARRGTRPRRPPGP